MTEQPQSPGSGTPSSSFPVDKDFLQNDIDRAIDFRKEYYKYAIGIATALLAFTVSFPPNLSTITYPALIILAWIGLGLAVIAGVFAHHLWAKFFVTWRDYDNRGAKDLGKAARRKITFWRRLADRVLLVALAVGVAFVVLFAAANVQNIATKSSAATGQSVSFVETSQR